MNKKTSSMLSAVALIAVIALAAFAYPRLTKRAGQNQPTGPAHNPAEQMEESGDVQLTVTDATGAKITLASKKGKVLILNFWATWCPPCRRELPAFNKLADEYKDKVEFMMIGLTDGARETVDKVKKFVADNKYTFPLYFDTEKQASSAFGIRGIPVTVAIGANGKVLSKKVGAMNEDELSSMIKSATESN